MREYHARFGGGWLEKCCANNTVTRWPPTLPRASSMAMTFSSRARKGIHTSGAQALFPVEMGTVQRLTQASKGQWGQKHDA